MFFSLSLDLSFLKSRTNHDLKKRFHISPLFKTLHSVMAVSPAKLTNITAPLIKSFLLEMSNLLIFIL